MKKILFAIAITTTLLASCTAETLTETDAEYSLYATGGEYGETDEDPDANFKRKATHGEHGDTNEDPDENN